MRNAKIALALTLIVIVAYAAPLFGGATFVARDHMTWTIPAKTVIAHALHHGHLAEWWDGVDMGVPLAANPAHSVLYPPTWIVGVAPMPWSVDFLEILHVLLAGLGGAALARRWGADGWGATLAGAALMLCGFTSSLVLFGLPILTFSWLPWAMWGADRLAEKPTLRSVLVMAAITGAQVLTGDPGILLVGGWLALAVVLTRSSARLRATALLACAYVAALALAAAIILPGLSLLGNSARHGGISGEDAMTWSTHPLRFIEMFWPGFFGDHNVTTQNLARALADSSNDKGLAPSWALSVYLSLPVMLLAALGWARSDRRLRYLLIAVVALALLALGKYTPIYSLYRAVFLPERVIRYPEKYLAGVVVLVCALCGVGWTSLVEKSPSRRQWIVFASVLGAFALLVAVAALFGHAIVTAAYDVSAHNPTLDVDRGLAESIRGGVVGLALVTVVALAVYVTHRRNRARSIGLVIIVAHLVVTNWQSLALFDRDIVKRPPQILANVAPPHRIVRSMKMFTPPERPLSYQARVVYEGAAANTATQFGFSYLIGYDQGYTAEWAKLEPTLTKSGNRVIDLYGADLAIVPAERTRAQPLGDDAPFGSNVLVRNEGARPRAFVTQNVKFAQNDEALAAALFPPGPTGIDANELATVHLVGTGTDVSTMGPLVPCAVTSPRPERVHVECESAGGYAVLLDTFAPGWTATVDGRPTNIERADALVRAVHIDAGRHVIEYSYATPGLRLGVIISLFAWLALIALAFGERYLMRSE